MLLSPKLVAGLTSVCVLAFHSNSFADQIFELPTSEQSGPASSLVSQFGGQLGAQLDSSEVVDSIPQLGVIIVRSSEAGQKARRSGLRSLGDVTQVQLVMPTRSSSLASVPSGLWGLKAIKLSKGWPVSQGEGVVVAVSDTGVSMSHPDLAGQMWKNPGETGVDSKGRDKATNKVDDDRNGYVDDVNGWNFVKQTNGGSDNHFHGSHVAGTIAARVGKSMAGVAPRAKIMDVSFLGGTGGGTDVNGAKTLVYAADNGAKIINCSWVGKVRNALLEKAVAYAESKGVLIVAAAGNDNNDNDKKLYYPAAYNSPNLLTVGATSTDGGARASFSNYGKTQIDLAAPGENIRSLAGKTGYQNLNGTSMATPHVSGVAALVWAARPQYTYAQVKKALMATRSASGWKKKSVTEGQLDTELALTH